MIDLSSLTSTYAYMHFRSLKLRFTDYLRVSVCESLLPLSFGIEGCVSIDI